MLAVEARRIENTLRAPQTRLEHECKEKSMRNMVCISRTGSLSFAQWGSATSLLTLSYWSLLRYVADLPLDFCFIVATSLRTLIGMLWRATLRYSVSPE